MKKALVLGVMAIFAISIANVNAQDRTNVQEKPKPTYTKAPTMKGSADSKTVSPAKPAPVSTTKNEKVSGSVSKNMENKTVATNKSAQDDAAKAQELEKAAQLEKNAAESEKASVNTSKGKTPINNSVPPTPKNKKAKAAKAATVKTR